MKKKLVLFLLALVFAFSSLPVFAYQINSEPAETEISDNRNGNQGCCSWHGGVCGSSGGRIMCCDGTISPSCRSDSYEGQLFSYQDPSFLFNDVKCK